MKGFVFYIYLCLLLFCGGHAVYANTHHPLHPHAAGRDFAKKPHSKLSNNDQTNTFFEDAEIDVEEEYLGDHDDLDAGANKFVPGKYSLPDWLSITSAELFISNFYNNSFNIIPQICGYSSPLYIIQRVLRI
ncbi:hypothetical protein OQY15_17045 [Pedobacter sp. MC2016-15]|uniref:hypothetical protein n=1 Tax=Pedobacter sp. MC2016-15 TaxID=2994473 RepID=UPI0022470C4B|nr:hypothetical protein [Pedobacter sp. MC2016-15]MCX2480814.1 hypothetical protein [Pedobacter sp. MC2016-15]